ncbi:polynucleotide kinase 3 phosphatase-domain-containing protein [Echria macrotheca]|uniref:Polynucleotide kinase 3 phosphatase-domain-containing protein n=1 Tax=Echria macrotheca TaxID=438768 RepID=A0AAJ0BKV3_9PEZI|nr:polynucleotide kinase 3 phosphatase-domain-containing protein [Echria macrotheca]
MPPARARKSPQSGGKRPAEDDHSVSPPPLKRKAQTAISKTAVANFFTPTSQKPKERTTWNERSPDEKTLPTLLVGKYVPEETSEKTEPLVGKKKIAAFDLDSTLIAPASGKRHSQDAADWKWWHHSVPSRVKQLHSDGYQIVIFTNQAGLTLHTDPKFKGPKNLKTRVAPFKQKCSTVLAQLDLPITIYAATAKDKFRKPRPGMWEEMKADYELAETDIDHENSIFVGDAGGRIAHLKGGTAIPKDFSCSDRNLADNIGIRFHTPEEFFLGEQPRDFARDFDIANFPFEEEDEDPKFAKTNRLDMVLFVGPPGSGKSTFFWTRLKPLGYERINQDTLKSKDKCFKAAVEALQRGNSVAVDNTNPDPDTRAQWVELAKKHKVPIRCVWFKTPLYVCEHNDAVRSLNKPFNPEDRESLPKLAFNGFASRFKEPKVKEGFQDVTEVEFKFRGTKEEHAIWARYWI